MNPYSPYQTSGKPVWVQGVEGAKAQYVAPGDSGIFMDSERQRFYIKTVDVSGVPMPLRAFDYKEVVEAAPQITAASGVTREEFDELVKRVNAFEMKGEQTNEQSAV
jgi:hypothetical protein